jgi:hypothetical protein
VATTGVAIGFSIAFEQNASDAKALRQRIGNVDNDGCLSPTPLCSQLGRIDDAEERNGALATGFYVAGAAAAAVGAASWFLWPGRKETGVRVLPVVGGPVTGMALRGTW